MSHWGDRLTEIRESKGLQQKEIADKMGIDYTAYNRYERGKTVNISRTLNKKMLNVFSDDEVDYIKNGGNIPSSVSEPTQTYGKKEESEIVHIPYYREVHASAGGGSDATDMSAKSAVPFSVGFLQMQLGIYNLRGISMINASGDSMSPTIKSGEVMFVAPVENEGFRDGSIYVLMCGDALLVKRVWLNPTTKVYTLGSDNEAVEDMTLTMDEGSECRFVGRVIGHLQKS